MTKGMLLGATSLRTFAAFGLAFALAGQAFAQDTTQDEQAPPAPSEVEAQSDTTAEPDEPDAIVVTGSRIRRPNLESTVPITSIGGESLFQQGDTNIGDTLNELPQLRSTFAQQNPGLGIGIAGLNLLDLRGLGTQRTLVLVNGRRHVPADILNNAVSPDVNTIPNDLIERVDIVTGGNSAIYGSDAIAGVVNFVLRRDFEGLQLRGLAAVTEEGFGGNQYVSAMYGHNFLDDRANVTVHGEYARQERIFASDIPWFRQQDGLFVVDSDSAGLTSNSDGFPDRVFLEDVRSTTIHRFGLIPIVQRTADADCGRGTLPNNGPANNLGTAYNCTYIFDAEGNLMQQTGTRFGAGPLGGIMGGNGQSGREGKLLSVLPFLERYNFNLLAHFTVSDAFEPFVEAKWNRVNALGNNAGPSFIQGQMTQFDYRERVRIDNPFLTPAQQVEIRDLILNSLCNTSLNAGCTTRTTFGTIANPTLHAFGGALNATDIAQLNAGTYRFALARHLHDVGIRDEKFQRDTFRIVGGARGTFNDDWNYEVSLNYGKFKEDITTGGFIDRQRFMLAIDAGRNPLTGQIQCRSQFDATAALPIQRTDAVSAAIAAQNAARLAADIAACVPYNPFGGTDNSESISYFARTFTNSSSLSQLVASAYVAGDSSQLFELPGGPVAFAIGAEYRKEKARYEQDPFVTDGFTNGVSIPTFAPDPFKVKELFGEIQIPILKDEPFFEEFTASGAARVAKYQGAVGTVWAYNAGLDWAPVRDLRFRGNYSRAVRAPNVSETAFPLVPNFAPGFQDPCNPGRINSGNFRRANCEADLGPLLAGLTDVTQSLAIVSGSNPNLTAETSDSYTIGAVIQPRWVPNLSLSVDYYDITVNGIITSLSAQAIVDACYDQPTLSNVFCAQFERWRGPGNSPSNDQPGRILSNSLIAAPLNFAKRIRKGIDVNAAYRTRLFDTVGINTQLIYTHNLQISNFQSATDPDFENRILGELGDPQDEFRWDTDFSYGPFTLGYRMRYIGPMWTNAFEDFNELQGRPPGDLDWSEPKRYPRVFYHDLRFQWDIKRGAGSSFGRDFQFYFGIDNVFDKKPPLGSTATGVGSAIYDIRGRNLYAGARARF